MINTEGLGRKLTLREIQLASLEILKAVDGICRERGLRYWLAYGTLLGAVRHKGFIPWDDDLDIMMPRPDYENLLSYFMEHGSELAPLVTINPDTVERCPFLITRISDMRYRMVGECGLDVEEMGAFIDVYPVDGLGDDESGARKVKWSCTELQEKYVHAGNFDSWNRGCPGWKRFFKSLRSKVMSSPKCYVIRERELLLSHEFDLAAYVGVGIWGDDPNVFECSVFKDTDWVVFEDMRVPIPGGYVALLKGQYDDYMVLPPEERRIGHHVYEIRERT